MTARKNEFVTIVFAEKGNVCGKSVTILQASKWTDADITDVYGAGYKVIATGDYRTCQDADGAWRQQQNAKKTVQSKKDKMDAAIKRSYNRMLLGQKQNDLATMIAAKLTAR